MRIARTQRMNIHTDISETTRKINAIQSVDRNIDARTAKQDSWTQQASSFHIQPWIILAGHCLKHVS